MQDWLWSQSLIGLAQSRFLWKPILEKRNLRNIPLDVIRPFHTMFHLAPQQSGGPGEMKAEPQELRGKGAEPRTSTSAEGGQ